MFYQKNNISSFFMEEAVKHCVQGIGIWDLASNEQDEDQDLVIVCAGDTPTLEAIVATQILRDSFVGIKIRFVNVIDLMRLESNEKHLHVLTDAEYDAIFT